MFVPLCLVSHWGRCGLSLLGLVVAGAWWTAPSVSTCDAGILSEGEGEGEGQGGGASRRWRFATGSTRSSPSSTETRLRFGVAIGATTLETQRKPFRRRRLSPAFMLL